MSDVPSIVPAIITPLTRTEQIKAVMTEFNLKYNAARSRIDPEFHAKERECKQRYAARRYRDDAEYRELVKQRAERDRKQMEEVPEAKERRREWYREYSQRPEVKARRAEQKLTARKLVVT
jgi:hypothetical protein